MTEIKGTLSIGEKIYFHEGYRCRLRICGFTEKQIEEMQKALYIDITLLQTEEKQEFVIEMHFPSEKEVKLL